MATGTLRMIVWNVKRGNAISLHLPNGKTVMIDCGNSDDCSPVDSLNKQKINTKIVGGVGIVSTLLAIIIPLIK